MTAAEFVAQHGDPTTWTDHDFRVYADLSDADHLPAQDRPAAQETALDTADA